MSHDWVPSDFATDVEVTTGFPFASDQYAMEGVRLLRGDNVAQGRIRWDGAKMWPDSKDDIHSRYRLSAGDVVLAMDRPWIEAGLKYATLTESDVPSLLVQRVARLKGRAALDTRFLGYLIASRAFTDHVLGTQTGTAVPHISTRQIGEFRYLRPPIEEQRAIASVLGALDDKIELNRRMSETLEALARAIFTSWFVDFDPVRAMAEGRQPVGMDAETAALFPDSFDDSPLGPIPSGWRVAPIGEVVTVVGGSTPRTGDPTFWEGSIPFATPKDLAGLPDPVLITTGRAITPTGAAQVSSGVLPRGTVLLSSRAPIGYLAVSEVPVVVNQGFIAMKCEGPVSNHYVLNWARHNMDRIVANANGTTFLEISKTNFRPIPTIVPAAAVLRSFEALVGPLYERITQNVREARRLSVARDALLPMLVSGRLRVTPPRQGATE